MALQFGMDYTDGMKANRSSAKPVRSSSPSPVVAFGVDEELDFQERIARRAYELWQQNGCPDGHETNFWLEAERQLLDESAKSRV